MQRLSLTLLLVFAMVMMPIVTSAATGEHGREVDTAIGGGLKWLASMQMKEGSEKGSWDSPGYRTAVASLAGLAFLANGYEPGRGEYGQAIDRAMDYVYASMNAEGYLGSVENTMYAHAFCTLFGLAYLGRSQDEAKEKDLTEWCRKAIELTKAAQSIRKMDLLEQGGWAYTPYMTSRSDVSVTSWQLQALHSARQCGYDVDPAIFQAALRYINSGYEEKMGAFTYRPGKIDPDPAITGVAVFIKSLIEKEPDERSLKAVDYLMKESPASWGGEQYNGHFFFVTFYLVQGMFQMGGEVWEEFGPKIQKVLVNNQNGEGYWDFPPDNSNESRKAGLAYPTAMSILILSLEKQYLPMYQRQRKFF
ncbi:MAG: terpene cyclase/mutase family protein [Planctomycetes bacterium]|nr:terpene cyclase/mutase family protein [Planctomycetota bacterium]